MCNELQRLLDGARPSKLVCFLSTLRSDSVLLLLRLSITTIGGLPGNKLNDGMRSNVSYPAWNKYVHIIFRYFIYSSIDRSLIFLMVQREHLFARLR